MISITIKDNGTHNFPKLLESFSGSVVLFLKEGIGIVLRSPVGYGRRRGDIGKFDMNRFTKPSKRITIKDAKIIDKLMRNIK